MKGAPTDESARQARPDTIDDATRRLLVQRVRNRRLRSENFQRDRPVDWRPWQVRNPNSFLGATFTDMTAWNFIADCLENGEPVEVAELDKPKGARGYVMKIELGPDVLYVKLQLTGSKVIGRSFHISEYSKWD